MIGQNGKNFKLNKILIIDSSIDLSKINKINEYENIITFDYEIHKTLERLNIQHTISDDYLDSIDLESIESLSSKLIKWYENPNLSSLLHYQNVNLGELVVVEFHQYLLISLKRIFELSKIFKTHGDSKYFCTSNLFEYMLHFTKNVEKINKQNHEIQFVFDTLDYNYRFWKLSLKITLSKITFLKLKNLSEVFIHKILGKKNYNKNFKTILFFNINTLKFKTLFENHDKSNLVVFNRKQPAIWNLSSFSIIKKSHSILEDNYSLKDKSLNNLINSELDKLKIILLKLKNNDSFFESFFSFTDIPIWKIIKNNFFLLIEKRFSEGILEIEYTKKLLNKYNFNKVLLLSENNFNEKILLSLIKKYDTKVILLQHGMGYDTTEIPEKIRQLAGSIPIISSIFFAWGNPTKHYLKNIGIPENKIKVVGSPIHDVYSDISIVNNTNKKYVLLITSSPTKWILNDLKIKTIENYYLTIKKICEITSKLNKRLIIKLHPDHDEIDITSFVKSIDPKIIVIKFDDTSKLLKNSDVVISIDLSTTILEAQLFKKPVIVVPVKNYPWGIPKLYISNSCYVSKIDELEDILIKLDRPSFRKILIENGSLFVNSYLINQGNATKFFYQFLNST